MSKKITLGALALGMILLSGCGGGGGSKEDPITKEIKTRDAIVILHEYPAGVCQSDTLKLELLKNGARDIITSVEDNSVNCEHYGRINDKVGCVEELFGGFPNACVIGLNAGLGISAAISDVTIASDNAIAKLQ